MSDTIQGTDAWLNSRMGIPSASRIFDILPGKRSAYPASRGRYMMELLAERISGTREEAYKSPAMEWGNEYEPVARSVYEAVSGNSVEEVGFIKHESLNMGASPDGLVGDAGGLEIKCPGRIEFFRVMTTGSVKPQYLVQMQVGLMCTGREWWDYFSFHPMMPDGANYYSCRYQRDDAKIRLITLEILKFNEELEELEEKIRRSM